MNTSLQERRVVVTGGAGFIGSHLVEALLSRGCFVHVLDDMSGGCRENLPLGHDRLRLDPIDISAPGETATLTRAVAEANLVFHLASPIGVRRAHENRLDVCGAILAGGLAVIAACRASRTPVLVASSSEVYGSGLTRPLTESDLAPLGLESRWGYATGKLALEHLVLGLHEASGTPGWVVRFFNIAGGRQRPETGLCVATFARAALEGRPIIVHGDGSQQRAFLHVTDAVAALLALVETPELIGRPVNIGGDATITIRQVAEDTVRLVNPSATIQFQPFDDVFGPAFSQVKTRIPNLSLVHGATSWRQRRTLGDIITDCAQTCRLAAQS